MTSPPGDAFSRHGTPSAAARLAELPRFRSTPSLEAFAAGSRRILDSAWGRRLDALKITGSNGKGTVATLAAAILQASGVRVGLYTSPHLRRFEERFRVNGQPIPPAVMTRSLRAIESHIEGLTAFEATTLLALESFAHLEVETVVAEAGMGGRFDPTRLLPGAVNVLTSVELEHSDVLGESRAEIAFDKADLADDGSTLLVGDVEPELAKAVARHVSPRGVGVERMEDVVTLGALHTEGDCMRVDMAVGDLVLRSVELRVLGAAQARNAALAVWAARRWLELQGRLSLSGPKVSGSKVPGTLDGTLDERAFEASTRHALRSTVVEGRMQLVSRDVEVWLDVAHSRPAIEESAATLRFMRPAARVIALCGVSSDREPKTLLPPITATAEHLVITRARRRGGSVERVIDALEGASSWQSVDALPSALEVAMSQARRQGAVVWVVGGLFLVAEVLDLLKVRSVEARLVAWAQVENRLDDPGLSN